MTIATRLFPGLMLILVVSGARSGSVDSPYPLRFDQPAAQLVTDAEKDVAGSSGALLVRFHVQTPRQQRQLLLDSLNCDVDRWFDLVAGLARVEAREDPAGTLAALRESPAVAYAEPDYVVQFAEWPDDPYLNEQWALRNIGQNVFGDPGAAGADMNIAPAWDLFVGDPDFVIAVIDGGVHWSHPDLASNIWNNAGEIPDNGIDDDGNGYVDDIRGWDFIDGDPDMAQVANHGTHVSGTIGAVGGNGLGITGVNQRCRIMPLRVISGVDGTVADVIDALAYALSFDVRVSNNSWVIGSFSQALYDAIDAAREQGHIFVAAAGNDGQPLARYPAGYDLDNIISVAATDNEDDLAGFSNRSPTSVDLGAPGVTILSTVASDGYVTTQGTSMAAPHVTGVVAMLAALRPTWTHQQIIEQILSTVRPVDSLAGLTVSGGVLDAGTAITSAYTPPEFEMLSGMPLAMLPGEVVDLQFRLLPNDGNLNGSPKLEYAINGGTWQQEATAAVGPDVFAVSLPQLTCGEVLRWRLVVDVAVIGRITFPLAESTHTTWVGEPVELIFDDAESWQGWTLSGDALAGHWQRGVPVNGGRGDPPLDFSGSGKAWLTENSLGPDGDGNSDVDGGATRITSAPLDLRNGGVISFAWWLNDVPGAPLDPQDGLRVSAATDAGGSNWSTLASYSDARAEWRTSTIELSPALGLTQHTRLRFEAIDAPPGAVVEAALDNITITQIRCSCPGDLDNNGMVDLNDLLMVISDWGQCGSCETPCAADANGDCLVDLNDLLLIISTWGTCS